MKICIDATPIGIKTTDKGGVYRYIFELVKSLSLIDQSNQYTLFFNFFRKEHLPTFHDTIRRLQVGENFHVRLSRFPWRLRRVIEPPIELLAGRFDIFHGCFDYLPLILLGKRVVTIHDVRYLENIEDETAPEWIEVLKKITPHPEFYIKDYLARGELFKHLRSTIERTIKSADAVITISQFCKNRIVQLLSIPQEKVRVIYHGVDKHFRPLSRREIIPVLTKFGINRPYIFYAGKFDPSKNLIRLIEAFKKIADFYDIALVMAGPVNWFYYILMEKARKLDIMGRIVFTDFVTDDEIVSLYCGASVFVMPSLYEGFGMPLVEAMACGVPIVTSNLCSIPEVLGDAAVFFDPYSAEDMVACIEKIIGDDGLRNHLREKGINRAKEFTWEEAAKETVKIYCAVTY